MKILKWIQKSFIIPTNLLKAGMVKVPSEVRGVLEYSRQKRGWSRGQGLMALIMALSFLFTAGKCIYGQESSSMVKKV